jgi:ribulose-phosphate 3-epimerase
MTTIVPAIIPKKFSDIVFDVERIKDVVEKVQIDICDGVFVKNTTWPYVGDTGEWPELVSEIIGLPFWEEIDYEFHLMVEHPEAVVRDYINAGASSLVVQVETVTNMKEISDICKASSVNLVVSLKPSTPVATLAQYEGLFDSIQCMGSNALGRHGVNLDETVYEKIRELKKIYSGIPLAIDIGVTNETAPLLVDAGVDVLVAGSAIFESDDVGEEIELLRNS